MAATPECLVMAKPAGPRCNLRCSYCYYVGRTDLLEGGAEPMSRELLERFIAERFAASPGPVTHFEWHGGEPTLLGVEYFETIVALQRRHLPAVPVERAFDLADGRRPAEVVRLRMLPAEHRCVVLLVNVSDQPVTAKLRLDAAACGVSGKQVRVTTVAPAGRGESFQSPPLVERELTLPARSTLAWELTRAGE